MKPETEYFTTGIAFIQYGGGKREKIIWKIEKRLYEQKQRFKTPEWYLIDKSSRGGCLRHGIA